MAVKRTASEAAERWVRKASQAAQDYRAGVERVTEAPTAKAARAKDLWLARLQEAAQRGKWERALDRVTLADWKRAATEKGAQRYAPGVQAAAGKMQAFMNEFLPHLAAGVEAIQRMPKLTLEDRIARAAAMIRHNAEFARRGGGGGQYPAS